MRFSSGFSGIVRGALVALSSSMLMGRAHCLDFKIEELSTELQVGYAVRTLDMNRDGALDIAIVDSKRVLWLENPTWEEHVVYETTEARFDNVCFAPHDIDGDGLVDFALGADWQFGNTNSGGTIGWLRHVPDGPWQYHAISIEPTTHRMNWADIDGDGRPWLVVAPLKGRGTEAPGFEQRGIRLLAFQPGAAEDSWFRRVITEQFHVMHNFEPVDLQGDGRDELVTASFEGASLVQFLDSGLQVERLGTGQEQPAPQKGASEIRLGKLASGQNYLATIEPWHGDKVVVYVAPKGWQPGHESAPWPRTVVDDELAWGHAVACANLDDDPDQELVIGVRDDVRGTEHRRGLRIYDPKDPSTGEWERTLVDPGGVAIEDLTVADLDGDGDIDIVTVGRQTHNVKIYWNSSR